MSEPQLDLSGSQILIVDDVPFQLAVLRNELESVGTWSPLPPAARRRSIPRLQRQDQTFISFHSQIDGHAKIEEGTLSVQPVLRIFGDVDANTGHITAKHDVHISGSVSPGYEIKSGGSVFIGGKVEESTKIHAQGNVIAAEGVFGSETKVVAFGNVETRCMQQSSILARGNISVATSCRRTCAAAAASRWAPKKQAAPSPAARSFPAAA